MRINRETKKKHIIRPIGFISGALLLKMFQKVAKKTTSVAMDIAPKAVLFVLVPALGNWFVDKQYRKRIEWDMRNECYRKWASENRDIKSRAMQLVHKMEAEMNKTRGSASDGH